MYLVSLAKEVDGGGGEANFLQSDDCRFLCNWHCSQGPYINVLL